MADLESPHAEGKHMQILDNIRKSFAAKRNDAAAAYRAMVEAVANGDAFDESAIVSLLASLGIGVEQFAADCQRFKARQDNGSNIVVRIPSRSRSRFPARGSEITRRVISADVRPLFRGATEVQRPALSPSDRAAFDEIARREETIGGGLGWSGALPRLPAGPL